MSALRSLTAGKQTAADIPKSTQMTPRRHSLGCILALRRPPALMLVSLLRCRPSKPIAVIALCWIGDPARGESVVRSLKAFGQPLADTVARKPFVEHQTMLDAGQPFGRRYYWKAVCLEHSASMGKSCLAPRTRGVWRGCLRQVMGRQGPVRPGQSLPRITEYSAPIGLEIKKLRKRTEGQRPGAWECLLLCLSLDRPAGCPSAPSA
jgi:hypothetical protein